MIHSDVNQSYIYVYSLPPESPSCLFRWAELPVLCSSFLIAILHMVAYMLILLSLFVLPSLPLSRPQIHSLCLCLYSCPANRLIHTIFLDSTYMCYYTIFVILWLTSPCMTDSRLICMIRNDPVSFLFMVAYTQTFLDEPLSSTTSVYFLLSQELTSITEAQCMYFWSILMFIYTYTYRAMKNTGERVVECV